MKDEFMQSYLLNPLKDDQSSLFYKSYQPNFYQDYVNILPNYESLSVPRTTSLYGLKSPLINPYEDDKKKDTLVHTTGSIKSYDLNSLLLLETSVIRNLLPQASTEKTKPSLLLFNNFADWQENMMTNLLNPYGLTTVKKLDTNKVFQRNYRFLQDDSAGSAGLGMRNLNLNEFFSFPFMQHSLIQNVNPYRIDYLQQDDIVSFYSFQKQMPYLNLRSLPGFNAGWYLSLYEIPTLLAPKPYFIQSPLNYSLIQVPLMLPLSYDSVTDKNNNKLEVQEQPEKTRQLLEEAVSEIKPLHTKEITNTVAIDMEPIVESLLNDPELTLVNMPEEKIVQSQEQPEPAYETKVLQEKQSTNEAIDVEPMLLNISTSNQNGNPSWRSDPSTRPSVVDQPHFFANTAITKTSMFSVGSGPTPPSPNPDPKSPNNFDFILASQTFTSSSSSESKQDITIVGSSGSPPPPPPPPPSNNPTNIFESKHREGVKKNVKRWMENNPYKILMPTWVSQEEDDSWQQILVDKIKEKDRQTVAQIFSSLSEYKKRKVITEDGDIALHIACQYGSAEIITDILNYSSKETAEITAAKANVAGDTPLHLASRYQLIKSILEILKALGNSASRVLQEKNGEGFTPLHLVAIYDQQDLICIFKAMLVQLGELGEKVLLMKMEKETSLIKWLENNDRLEPALWLELYRGVAFGVKIDWKWLNQKAEEKQFYTIDFSGVPLGGIFNKSQILKLLEIKKIKAINLSFCKLNGYYINTIKRLFLRDDIENIDLYGNYLDDSSARIITESIKQNINLIFLNLESNKISPKILHFISTYLDRNRNFQETIKYNFQTLTSLSLSKKSVDDLFLKKLAPFLEEAVNLSAIDLSDNKIENKGVEDLIKVLKNTLLNRSIKFIDLSNNFLAVKTDLMNNFVGTSIESVNLNKNYIEDDSGQWEKHLEKYSFLVNEIEDNLEFESLAVKRTRLSKSQWNLYLIICPFSNDSQHVKILVEGVMEYGLRFIRAIDLLPDKLTGKGVIRDTLYSPEIFYRLMGTKYYVHHSWLQIKREIIEKLFDVIQVDKANPPTFNQYMPFLGGVSCFTWVLDRFEKVGLDTQDVKSLFLIPSLCIRDEEDEPIANLELGMS